MYGNKHAEVYSSSQAQHAFLQAADGKGTGEDSPNADAAAAAARAGAPFAQWARWRGRRRVPDRVLEQAQTNAWLRENGFTSAAPSSEDDETATQGLLKKASPW